ncbi:MAG: NUDIX hydrolase [Acinetobacter sp.]|nr:NUDIX hydrolase [Acinetobacter sp.]
MAKFCQNCGHATEKRIPALDHAVRDVCTHCDFIHYENPKMVCGALITHQQKILLCKRAIEPSYGLWTLPAGYLEIGETMEQGAARESWEEAEAEIDIQQLYCLYNITHVGHIYVLFKAELKHGTFGNGEESLETRLFTIDEIPWQQLAFPSIARTLEHYLHDRHLAQLPVHLESFDLATSQQFYNQLKNDN